MSKILFLFLDGVGIGDDAEYNPFTVADLPVMRALFASRGVTRVALDATLGIEGTPQSGTGQATLFTGRNAAALHGRHFGPWVPTAIRPLLRRESILAIAARNGRRVTFANAYPSEMIDVAMRDDDSARIPSFLRAGPPVAAAGAHVLTRTESDLEHGNAIASEIVNDGWRERLGFSNIPIVTARAAGATLAGIASSYDLTLFAHYATDAAGHLRDMDAAVMALARVDEFLGGIVDGVMDDMLIIVASDHGNIEDIRTGHTRNPALGLIIGPDHARYSKGVASLEAVAPLIERALDLPS